MNEKLHPREPARVRLANVPTRGHWLRYDAGVGARFWLKRDDHTGSELMGNKVRKLEYLLAEAQVHGATHVITCGGEQSNHARATALAATQLGMRSVLVLRSTIRRTRRSRPATSCWTGCAARTSCGSRGRRGATATG